MQFEQFAVEAVLSSYAILTVVRLGLCLVIFE